LAAQRAAEEAARQAAAEAARQAAAEAARAERARQVAEDRRERRLQEADGAGRYQTPTSGDAAAPATAPTYSVQEAQDLAASATLTASDGSTRIPPKSLGDRWWEDPPAKAPAGTGTVPVTVRPAAGAAVLADDWRREAKAEIGMGDPKLFDGYMAANAPAVDGLASVVANDTTAVPDMLLSGDLSDYTNDLVNPALAHLRSENPDASFRLLAVEQQALPWSGGPAPLSPLVIEMTNGGQVQQFVIQPDSSWDSAQYRAFDALQSDPALLQQWDAVARPLLEQGGVDVYPGDDPGRLLDRATFGNFGGGFDEVVAGIKALPPEAQAQFSEEFAGSFLLPLSEPIPQDAVILSVDASGLAAGQTTGEVSSQVNLDAIDGLATSTALPPVGDLSLQQWRTTLDRLSTNPPATMADLRTELQSAGVTPAQLQELQRSDANALPAVLSLVQDHPPVSFNDQLNLTLTAATGNQPATFDSVRYDAHNNVVIVETSLNHFVSADTAAGLAETYAVGDMPMTLRIPLTDGAANEAGWTSLDGTMAPTEEQLAALNARLQEVDQASVFLHGYQSDRGVWTQSMQDFMDMSGHDTIGIAFSGMGAEGDFLGSGASPLTAKQYAFHTMAAMDALGLYGKDLTLYGHSMGGAAALQMALATERMVAAGEAERPDVKYVLLQPAPSGDSVPFLTQGGNSALISVQNWAGTTDIGLLEGAARVGNDWMGAGVVADLMPGAPAYIQAIHAGFANQAGFAQLKATAAGLTDQGEPDPQELQALLSHNDVLVVGGTEDRIVSTEALEEIFGPGRVFEVPGNHYAHLPSTIPDQNAAESQVWPRIRDFLHPYPIPVHGPR